ncbi:hypothetical protein WJX72_003241 [[Myrmecia] bisecta]|uniref:SMP-30/Gluconolactonase/LRE-like region domain-containing protein n=1 Tax=[Myrmecia] bisecta TaxID=41462 RepID=A0AAW1PBT6_9CHLO
MASQPKIELVVNSRCILGESPVWDERTGTLYFVDINSKRLHAFVLATGQQYGLDFYEKVGTIAPTTDKSKLLAALSRDVVIVDLDKRLVGPAVATVPESHGVEEMRFNDGKASPAGVFVVGRMHNKWRDNNPGRLYAMRLQSIPESSTFQELLTPEEVVLPNGMAWDTQRSLMYFVDTGLSTITAYKTDGEGVPVRNSDGKHDSRVVVTIPKEEGIPDGMTIAADGNLWVALADGGAVACYDANSGKQLHKVQLPVKRPTACTFGGPGLKQLFVTTREEPGNNPSEHWGGVFSVEVEGVKGAAAAYAVKLPVQ